MRTLDGSQRIWFGFSWRKVATGARPLSETLGECALIFLHCVNTCSTLFSGTLTGIIPHLQHVDEQLCAPVPQRKRLEQQWILMHTQLAPLSKWDIISRYPSQAGRPTLILLWLVCCEGAQETGGKAQCLQSICFGNKWIQVFLESAPEMRRSVIEGQGSTYVSLCDREITPRWQKASATSITCTALPAISKSLKAIEKGISLCYNEVRFYPDDWQRIFASAVIHV